VTGRGDIDAVVLIPVKDFELAKGRLAPQLPAGERAELARSMAARVVRAAGRMPALVVCDDDEVADWARSVGAHPLRIEVRGLNGALTAAVERLSALGPGESPICLDPSGSGAEPNGRSPQHVVIAHGDLPRAETLEGLAEAGTVTIVPDRHLDGTNVMALPLGAGFEFHYGPGSFRAHCDEALRCGLDLRVRRVAALEFDIDTPDDLAAHLAAAGGAERSTAASDDR
jgi:2-phospho-L-lactate guanylyltransferase